MSKEQPKLSPELIEEMVEQGETPEIPEPVVETPKQPMEADPTLERLEEVPSYWEKLVEGMPTGQEYREEMLNILSIEIIFFVLILSVLLFALVMTFYYIVKGDSQRKSQSSMLMFLVMFVLLLITGTTILVTIGKEQDPEELLAQQEEHLQEKIEYYSEDIRRNYISSSLTGAEIKDHMEKEMRRIGQRVLPEGKVDKKKASEEVYKVVMKAEGEYSEMKLIESKTKSKDKKKNK